jgi:hypothetical protein
LDGCYGSIAVPMGNGIFIEALIVNNEDIETVFEIGMHLAVPGKLIGNVHARIHGWIKASSLNHLVQIPISTLLAMVEVFHPGFRLRGIPYFSRQG